MLRSRRFLTDICSDPLKAGFHWARFLISLPCPYRCDVLIPTFFTVLRCSELTINLPSRRCAIINSALTIVVTSHRWLAGQNPQSFWEPPASRFFSSDCRCLAPIICLTVKPPLIFDRDCNESLVCVTLHSFKSVVPCSIDIEKTPSWLSNLL